MTRQGESHNPSHENQDTDVPANQTQSQEQPHQSHQVSELAQQEETKVAHPEQLKGLRSPYQIGENIDCLDTVKHWLNAEVISVRNNEIKVHYSGWGLKYDEWIEWDSSRLQKQWSRGMPFQLNTRLDVLDEEDNWLEARVINMADNDIEVHYYGFSKKFDDWIPKNSDRIAEVGRYSKAYGAGKFERVGRNIVRRSKVNNAMMKEDQFRKKLLESKQFIIIEVGGQGNCLFRSFSHQLYATPDHHMRIRQVCMDYIRYEKEYFKNYIVGGEENFEEYIQVKSEDGTWGDDLEIQALSEIYNRAIEIYAYSSEPLLRISYHGRSHYCSVKQKDAEFRPLIDSVFGVSHCIANDLTLPQQIENTALRNAELRAQKLQELKDKNMLEPGKTYDDSLMNEVLQASRSTFETNGRRDMEVALEESLNIYCKEHGITPEQEIETTLKASMDTFQQEMDEEKIVEATMNESKKIQESNDDELQQALEMSKADFFIQEEEHPPSVKEVVQAGFPVEYALEAFKIIGDDPQLMIQYICETLLS